MNACTICVTKAKHKRVPSNLQPLYFSRPLTSGREYWSKKDANETKGVIPEFSKDQTASVSETRET